MVTKAEALAELERRKANVGQVSASEAQAELANREVGRYSGLTGEVRKIAESGIKNLASFGSTEPLYEAETSLGRIFANVGRPFRPVLGAMELATAPTGALLREYVGEPVEELTKNPALGTIAEIAGAIAAPSQLSRLGSLARPPQETINPVLGKIAKKLREDIPNQGQLGEALAAYQKAPGVGLLESAGGAATKRLAEGASVFPSTAKPVEGYFSTRVAQSQKDISKSIAKTISPKADFYGTVDDVLEKGREAASPVYKEVFGANQSLSSPRLNRILNTPAGKKALRNVAGQFQNRMQLLARPDAELTEVARELAGMSQKATFGGVGSGLKLKALDAIKKELDTMTFQAKRASDMGNQAAGNDYRAFNDVRAALIDELDNLDNTGGLYAKARSMAGDYITVAKAADDGINFLKQDPELLVRDISKMTAPQKQAYQMGAAKALRDMINNKADGRNVADFFNKPAMRARIKAITTPESYKEFEKFAQDTDDLFKLRNQMMAGSPTARRLEASREFDSDALDFGLEVVSGGGAGIGSMLARKAQILAKKYTTGLSDKSAYEAATIFFETDPSKKALIVKQILNAAKKNNKQNIDSQKTVEAFFTLQDMVSASNPFSRATAATAALTANE